MVHALLDGMPVQTDDFVDLASTAQVLRCRVPVGIALFPGNFSTAANAGEFCYHPATPYIRSAWQTVHLEDEGPSGGGVGDQGSGVSSGIRTPAPNPQPLAPSESAEVPLSVFFGAGLLASPSWRLTVALGMVSSVLASHPRCASPRDVRLDIVVERPGNHGYAGIEYQGDAFGIIALAREVRRIWDGK
jgi:hypothetical protein